MATKDALCPGGMVFGAENLVGFTGDAPPCTATDSGIQSISILTNNQTEGLTWMSTDIMPGIASDGGIPIYGEPMTQKVCLDYSWEYTGPNATGHMKSNSRMGGNEDFFLSVIDVDGTNLLDVSTMSDSWTFIPDSSATRTNTIGRLCLSSNLNMCLFEAGTTEPEPVIMDFSADMSNQRFVHEVRNQRLTSGTTPSCMMDLTPPTGTSTGTTTGTTTGTMTDSADMGQLFLNVNRRCPDGTTLGPWLAYQDITVTPPTLVALEVPRTADGTNVVSFGMNMCRNPVGNGGVNPENKTFYLVNNVECPAGATKRAWIRSDVIVGDNGGAPGPTYVDGANPETFGLTVCTAPLTYTIPDDQGVFLMANNVTCPAGSRNIGFVVEETQITNLSQQPDIVDVSFGITICRNN